MAVRYQRLDAATKTSNTTVYLVLIVLTIVILLFYLQQTRSQDVFSENPLEPKMASSFDKMISQMRIDLQEKMGEIQNLQADLKEAHKNDEKLKAYRRRPENIGIDCQRLFSNDKVYMKQISRNRVQLVPTELLDMNCGGVRQRVLPPVQLDSLRFGVAFARIVYKDYEMLEDQVRWSYHPQNAFCFAIDRKADALFHKRLKALASCLPNVLLLPDEESVDSSGHNVNLAHYNCMKALINKPGWGYVMLLQNHDVISKSVYELQTVFETLGGANDVELTPDAGRANTSFGWDALSLKLFRNESAATATQLATRMKFSKGAAQASFSRAAVDWMVRTADLTTFIAQMNTGGFGVDEQMAQSFQVSSALGMPGHFTDECLRKGYNSDFVTRMSQWMYSSHEKCASNVTRHAICLLGVEDLPTIAQFPTLMVNKFMPDFDYAAVDCLGELLFNRTIHRQVDHPLDVTYYSNMVNVLYHKNRDNPKYSLDCKPKYTPWQLRKYPV